MKRFRFARRCLVPVALVVLAGCGSDAELPLPSESWHKIDADGEPLVAGGEHRCVLDERTGLMWEVKREDSRLHQPGQTYTWFSSDDQVNMSEAGVRDRGDCVHSRCDTEGFVEAVNASGLCGHKDWYLPSRNELMTLGDRRLIDTGLIVNTRFFPHTEAGEYWASETFRMYPQSGWAVDMRHGLDRADYKQEAKSVRLVRRHQPPAGEDQ